MESEEEMSTPKTAGTFSNHITRAGADDSKGRKEERESSHSARLSSQRKKSGAAAPECCPSVGHGGASRVEGMFISGDSEDRAVLGVLSRTDLFLSLEEVPDEESLLGPSANGGVVELLERKPELVETPWREPEEPRHEKPEEKPPPGDGPCAADSPVVRLRQPHSPAVASAGEPLLDVNGRRPEAHRKFLVEVRLEEASHKKVPERWDVCHFSALPKWLQDNDYLIHGHRPPLPSFRACALSVFRVHTETGNIWSHLLGSLAFATTGALFLWRHSLALPEQAVFGAFFFCVFLCFFTSTLYHTMHCHSEHVGKFFSRLDYCGIVSIVAGCFTPWIHFLFWCEPRTKLFYLLLGYLLCVVTINLTMWEKFGRPQFRLLRASIFTGLAISCSLLPGVHFVAVHGLYMAFVELAYGWLLGMSLVALVGVALYALRVPERYFPGRCDILFHSHQFFHLAVIVGAYVHLRCLCVMALFRHQAGAECQP